MKSGLKLCLHNLVYLMYFNFYLNIWTKRRCDICMLYVHSMPFEQYSYIVLFNILLNKDCVASKKENEPETYIFD
jgi:hypothetical protein